MRLPASVDVHATCSPAAMFTSLTNVYLYSSAFFFLLQHRASLWATLISSMNLRAASCYNSSGLPTLPT